MAHKTDSEMIQHTHNTARFFVEHRQIALVLLLGTFMWGWYGYSKMSKRKDPVIPVRIAVASCKWPGATAEEIEQLITRPIEQTMAQNQAVKPPEGSDYGIRSISFPNFVAGVCPTRRNVKDTRQTAQRYQPAAERPEQQVSPGAARSSSTATLATPPH